MSDEGELIAEILCIAGELGGTVERTQTLNSVGRSSKKIIIEYDVQNRKSVSYTHLTLPTTPYV